MEEKKFIYDAFISYRHTELDKYVAETLHKKMESFKLPKNVVKEGLSRTKISRVFRDKDELPLASNLEDPIINALENSEFLVVICSPRLKESIWCKKEIQTFIKLHGRRKVLAVLVEGEPQDSFPDELLYDEEEIVDEATGEKRTVRKPIEPLAADFRGSNKAEIDKAMKTEMLRLLAPMFGVSFDDLRQRHKELRLKKIMTVSAIVATVGITFGAVSTAMAIRIHQQSESLAKQQVYSLVEDAYEYFEANNRKEAVNTAYMAMTNYEGVDLPYTPEAEAALSKCLSIYDGGYYVRPSDHIEFEGAIEDFKLSPNKDRVIVADNLGNISVLNIADKAVLSAISDAELINDYDFIDDDSFIYLTDKGNLYKVDIASGEKTLYEMDDFDNVWDVVVSPDHKTIILRMSGKYEVLDATDLSEKASYNTDSIDLLSNICADEKTNYVLIETNENEVKTLRAIDPVSGSEVFNTPMPQGDITAIESDDENIYVLSYYSKTLISGTAIVTSINKVTGEVNYTKEYDRIVPHDITYSNVGNLLVTGYTTALITNAKTGDVLENYELSDRIIMYSALDNGTFSVYTSDGTTHVLDPENDLSDLAFTGLICSDVTKLRIANSAMVGVRENDNRLILYTYFKNIDSFVYDKELAQPDITGTFDLDAIEFGKEKGIDKASLICASVEIPDSNLTLFLFKDGKLSIFKSDTMELISEYSDCVPGTIKYYGKINNRHVFDIGYEGYLFGEDGLLRARIDNFAGVTSDKNNIVVFGKDDDRNNANIALPVYDKEEVLAKSKRFLDRYKEQ